MIVKINIFFFVGKGGRTFSKNNKHHLQANNPCAFDVSVSLFRKVRGIQKIHTGYGKGKGHPCTGTEALYRPYGP